MQLDKIKTWLRQHAHALGSGVALAALGVAQAAPSATDRVGMAILIAVQLAHIIWPHAPIPTMDEFAKQAQLFQVHQPPEDPAKEETS